MSWDGLRISDARQLKQALGKSAYVYAPYVLLRSYEQWRQRESVNLPDNIRPILEVTYAAPAADEPDGWRVLREELEENKRKLAAHAKSATAIWNMPALSDEEGVQTRWERHSTVYLLLAKSVEARGDQTADIELLNGDIVTADARQYSFGVAKAIFRNLVRIPRWPVNEYLAKQPAWLGAYVNQSSVVGLCREGGHIAMPNEENDSGLSYSANEGLVISKAKPRSRTRDEEDYESCD
jgi:CRISPR-associated endonuclease/helicase Cas3